MPLTTPPATPAEGAAPIGALGLLATTPSAMPTGYSWGFVQESKALPAYAANDQSTAYVGGLLDLLSAARLTDLNKLRAAVENLRTLTENTAKQHNQLCRDLIAAGLIGQ